LRDVFWHVWHETFQPNEEIQSKLLDRIAKNYVTLFLSCKLIFKDHFFKAYPNIMAESTNYAFFYCFPKSLKHFTMEFKMRICDCYSRWLNGIEAPAQPWCLEWEEFDILTIMKQEKMLAEGNVVKEMFDDDLDVLAGGKVAKEITKSLSAKKEVQVSCRVGPGPKIKRAAFVFFCF
jgi:hypothetical protein